MVIFNRTIDGENEFISHHKEARELSEAMQNARNQKTTSQRIFIWNDFGNQVPVDLFDDNKWQQKFVELFSSNEMWPWKFKFAKTESDRLGNQDLIEALSHPTRGIIASLRIRDFDSDDLFQGSLEWFEEIIPFLNYEYNDSKILIDQTIKSLRLAKEVGINLFLEKISLIINHDPENSITLTPHLHRDGAYGYLESGIVSFYSERITPNSSTLFFPDFDFESASHLKPITAEKLNSKYPSTTAYSTTSGSLAIFSGKLASDGSKSDALGALHMSPEGFIPTRRIAFLFKSKISY